jgi:putrescine aminotransferase
MSGIQKQNRSVLQAIDADHHVHPFTNTQELNDIGSRVITRGAGAYVWDAQGEKMIDAMAGLWCVNLGYSQPDLVAAAHAQLQELPYYNTFFRTTTPAATQLSQALAAVTPADLNHIFYANSGSEAVDSMIRLVRFYWQLQGSSKHILISRENAYHGSTIAGMSLGGMGGMHKQGRPLLPGFAHISQPYWYGNAYDGESEDDFGLRMAQKLEDKILELGPELVAAFVGEPLQGAGGVIVPPKTYWPEIERICRKYDILLVADEVICGFGRTGRWFGCETFGFTPDIITMAKGLTSGYIPMSAIAMNDRVADVLIEKGGEYLHGFTYSGHPVAAAVALKNIEIMQQSQLVNHVHDDIGVYFQQKLRDTLADHPLVGHIEGVGLVAGFALVQHKEPKAFFPDDQDVGYICREHCFKNGIIMRAVGNRMVLSPPLIITKAQVDEICTKALHCLDLTYADVRAC